MKTTRNIEHTVQRGWIRALILILLPPLAFVAFVIARFFYGPVTLEIRNGSGHPMVIERVDVQRCPTCSYSSVLTKAFSLSPDHRDFVSFNAGRGHLTLRLQVVIPGEGQRLMSCQMEVVQTACEATAYVSDIAIECEPCTHY